MMCARVLTCLRLQVPALASPGMEAPFELRLLCGVPLELVPLPELRTVVLQVGGKF